MSKWQTFRDVGAVTDNDNRRAIFETIKSNPGIHFRGIREAVSKENGVVQYHLSTLERFGFIVHRKDGKFKRYYEKSVFKGEKAMMLVATSRRRVEKEIVSLLASGKDITTSIKMAIKNTGVTSQAVLWHVKRLKREGYIKDGVLAEGFIEEYNALGNKGII